MTANSTRRKTAALPASSRPGDPDFYRGDAFEINESVGYMLKQLRSAMERAIDTEMDEFDLTGVQWGPLLMIDRGLGSTAAELARVGCVDTGAMTRMLNRLEAKGLLRRKPCPKDRRVMQLELTDEGQRLCYWIPFGLSRVQNAMLRGFSKSEVETLKSLVRRMLVNSDRK